EDGIRDFHVTGVQTCALPICTGRAGRTGEALSFVTPHERGRLRAIERTTRTPLQEVEIPSPADVSAHKVRTLLGQVPARLEAGQIGRASCRERVESAGLRVGG